MNATEKISSTVDSVGKITHASATQCDAAVNSVQKAQSRRVFVRSIPLAVVVRGTSVATRRACFRVRHVANVHGGLLRINER